MRIKQVLWVLAAFTFTSLLYLQGGQAPTESATSAMAKTQMDAKTRGQTGTSAKGPVPLTEKEVTKEIKSAPAETVIKDVKERGVDFDMTPDIEKKLRKAKATDAVVEAVRKAGPKVRAQMAKIFMGPGQAETQEVPREQAQAYEAIKTELDPDKAIAIGEDFIKKYPDSILLPYVYFFTANGYQQKGAVDKVADYTAKGLKLKPDNMACLVMRVGVLPQPQYLNAHAADRDAILDEAEKDANRALQLISAFPKQPNETDQDYKKRQDETGSQIHGSLGMVYLQRAADALTGPDKAELAKAEQEFKAAVTTTDRPYPGDYFYLGEAYKLDGKFDDAIGAYTKAGEAGQGTTIKAYADSQVEVMKKLKAQQGSTAPKH
jgi:tetratricopeptide (TPR) repeat protein